VIELIQVTHPAEKELAQHEQNAVGAVHPHASQVFSSYNRFSISFHADVVKQLLSRSFDSPSHRTKGMVRERLFASSGRRFGETACSCDFIYVPILFYIHLRFIPLRKRMRLYAKTTVILSFFCFTVNRGLIG
jgi:hypothetical protein